MMISRPTKLAVSHIFLSGDFKDKIRAKPRVNPGLGFGRWTET